MREKFYPVWPLMKNDPFLLWPESKPKLVDRWTHKVYTLEILKDNQTTLKEIRIKSENHDFEIAFSLEDREYDFTSVIGLVVSEESKNVILFNYKGALIELGKNVSKFELIDYIKNTKTDLKIVPKAIRLNEVINEELKVYLESENGEKYFTSIPFNFFENNFGLKFFHLASSFKPPERIIVPKRPRNEWLKRHKLLSGKIWIFSDFLFLSPSDERLTSPLIIPCPEKIKDIISNGSWDEFYIYTESELLKKIKLDPTLDKKFREVWVLNLNQLEEKEEPSLHLDKKREVKEADQKNEDDEEGISITVGESGGLIVLSCFDCERGATEIKIIDFHTQMMIQKITLDESFTYSCAVSFFFPRLILGTEGGFIIYEHSSDTQKFEKIVSGLLYAHEFLEGEDRRFQAYFKDFTGAKLKIYGWESTLRFFGFRTATKVNHPKIASNSFFYVIDLVSGKLIHEEQFKELDEKNWLLWDHRLVYTKKEELIILDLVTKTKKSLLFCSLVSEACGAIQLIKMIPMQDPQVDPLELIFQYETHSDKSLSQTVIKRLRLIPDVL